MSSTNTSTEASKVKKRKLSLAEPPILVNKSVKPKKKVEKVEGRVTRNSKNAENKQYSRKQPYLPCHEKTEFKWQKFKSMESGHIQTTADVVGLIKELNPRFSKWNFDTLLNITDELTQEEMGLLLEDTFPGIVTLAQQLDDLFPKNKVWLLRAGDNERTVMSKAKIASLLANAFLCNFSSNDSNKYPSFNFITLYKGGNKISVEKLKCILCYFKKIIHEGITGHVKFVRVSLPSLVDWANSKKPLTIFEVQPVNDRLENSSNQIQIDFANKMIGGGVLGHGCVQEEIRFITCPELIVARLFTEKLGDNEAVLITGVQQYSAFEGYQDTFKWVGPYEDDPKQASSRILVAIDALDFSSTSSVSGLRDPKNKKSKPEFIQYSKRAIDRELNKAFAGFTCCGVDTHVKIASGNWGGGSFKGDPVLKAKIQHLAASQAGRTLVYFPYQNPRLRDQILKKKFITGSADVGQCYKELLKEARQTLKSLQSK